MVLADRNSNDAGNGRRCPEPCPNGPASESSSKQAEKKMRVGRDYQAIIPELISAQERRPEEYAEKALHVWSPAIDIPDYKLDEYISLVKEKHGFNRQQALSMLFWHNHDLEQAILDCANFAPLPSEWSLEDKAVFEKSFECVGKKFHEIRKSLPDKSIASLVSYYYSWKKPRNRKSLKNRRSQTLVNRQEENSAVGSEISSNVNSDSNRKDIFTENNQLPHIECSEQNYSSRKTSTPTLSLSGNMIAEKNQKYLSKNSPSKCETMGIMSYECQTPYTVTASSSAYNAVDQEEAINLCLWKGRDEQQVAEEGLEQQRDIRGGRSSANHEGTSFPYQRLQSGSVTGFECFQCGKVIKRKDHLRDHMRIHSGERPYKCLECNKSFTKRSDLTRHMCLHSQEWPYKCSQCGKLFKQRCRLTAHMHSHN